MEGLRDSFSSWWDIYLPDNGRMGSEREPKTDHVRNEEESGGDIVKWQHSIIVKLVSCCRNLGEDTSLAVGIRRLSGAFTAAELVLSTIN